MYRLHKRGAMTGARLLGLSCDESGLYLGGEYPLVTCEQANGQRVYRPRPIEDISRALSIGYGVRVDFGRHEAMLERIASHLTKGDWGLAQIIALQMRLPDLADSAALDRLMKADELLLYNPNHDERGRFATAPGGTGTTGSNAASRAAPIQMTARPLKQLSISPRGKEFIRRLEKLRLNTYDSDGAHVVTIGYGHEVQPGEHFPAALSVPAANQLFDKDINVAEAAVRKHVTVPLTQSQFDALVSVAFDKGETGFRKSELLREVNAKDFSAAADALLTMTTVIYRDPKTHQPIRDPQTGRIQTHSARGLANRREKERAIFVDAAYG